MPRRVAPAFRRAALHPGRVWPYISPRAPQPRPILISTPPSPESIISEILRQRGLQQNPPTEPTRAPTFIRLLMSETQQRIEGASLDFRDEIMAQIFGRGDPTPKRTLTFHLEVTEDGVTSGTKLRERRTFSNWRRSLEFEPIHFDAAHRLRTRFGEKDDNFEPAERHLRRNKGRRNCLDRRQSGQSNLFHGVSCRYSARRRKRRRICSCL